MKNTRMQFILIGLLLVTALLTAGCVQGTGEEGPQASPTNTPQGPTSTPPPPTATDTYTPTATSTITLTPTPSIPQLTVDTPSNCRGGPGVVYHIITAVRSGRTMEIVGKSEAYGPLWWKVSVGNVECWIWSGLGDTSGDVEQVPFLAAPPTPTPEPRPTATPTPRSEVQFPVTVVNKSDANICYIFISFGEDTGWGDSRLPANAYIPRDGKITFLLGGGTWNFRAEDCKDDVIEILTDASITEGRIWTVDGEDG